MFRGVGVEGFGVEATSRKKGANKSAIEVWDFGGSGVRLRVPLRVPVRLPPKP